jgi:sugar O-acyltransferase (sialic acid O-acetyltransferase NeuD family)
VNAADAPLVVWGGRGHALVVAELVATRGQEVVLVVDRDPEVACRLDGVPKVVGLGGLDHWLARWNGPAPSFALAIGGARGAARRELHGLLVERGLLPAPLVHPGALVADTATVGPGSQVLLGAVVAAAAVLGTQVIVNTSASIDHECHLGDGAHIGPGSTLAGAVDVGVDVFVGAGAVVLPRVHLGDGAVVGAGAVVTRDVAPGSVVVGVPARPQPSS